MTIKFDRIKFYIVMGVLLVSSVLCGGVSHAENDLLWDLVQPSYESDTTINAGKNSKTVGNRFLGSSHIFKVKKEIKFEDGKPLCHNGECAEGCDGTEDKKECQYQHVWVNVDAKSSVIVKVTKLLLILTVALSVTMILYNGMMYIIQTGQGKEGKSLMKNIALIVVGILISFFSVVIIRLIQSIPTTLDDTEELGSPGYEVDNEVLE